MFRQSRSGAKRTRKASRLTFSPESAARNVWLNENGSVELDEYTVPTKSNRGAVPMTHRRFNASDPQSSAVRLGRALDEPMWNPEHSAAKTYESEETIDNARRNETDMRTRYGEGWVNAIVRRDEAKTIYQQVAAEAKRIGNAALKETHRKYRAQWGQLPKNITAYANSESRKLRTMNINRDNQIKRRAVILAERNAALAKIPSEELAAYEREIEEIHAAYRNKAVKAEGQFQNAIDVGVLPLNMQRAFTYKQTTKAPLATRLNAAAMRAAVQGR